MVLDALAALANDDATVDQLTVSKRWRNAWQPPAGATIRITPRGES